MVTINEVADLLQKKSLDFCTIDYPINKEKSIDIIAINRNNSKLVVKVQNYKNSKIKTDLKNMAKISGTIPVIIEDDNEEEVISDKGNVLSMNIMTFEKILNGEKIFLYKTRGGTFVKIRSKELRRKREEMGLSLGEVAQALGVSRISIYDYEKEDSFVSIDVAEKLVNLFGEDILGDVLEGFKVDNETEEPQLDDSFSMKLVKHLNEKGYIVGRMKFTAVDYIASKSDRKIFFSIELKSYSESLKKFSEARKISKKINAKLLVVIKDNKNRRLYEKEDFNTISEYEIAKYEFDWN